MGEDLKEMLHLAEPDETAGPPMPLIVRRGRGLRRRRYAAALGAFAIVAVAAPTVVPRIVDAVGQDRPVSPAGEQPVDTDPVPREVAEVPLDGSPAAVVATETDAWVAHSDGSGGFVLSRVPAATDEVAQEVALDGFPVDLEHEGALLWILLRDGGSGGRLLRADAATGEVEEQSLELEFDTLDMAAAGDLAWVTSSDGQVYEVDWAQRSVSSPLGTPGHFVATDGSATWVATIEGAVTSLDGEDTNASESPNIVGLDVAGGYVWITQQLPSGGLRVTTLNPDGARAGRSELFPAGSGSLVATAESAWVVVDAPGKSGSVVAVARDGGRRADVEVGRGPVAVALSGDDVWVANFADETLSHVKVE